MNREIVIPGVLYPLIGDVTSTAGNASVQVTGLQGIPIVPTFFQGGEVMQYSALTGLWTPTVPPGITVNGSNSSGDYFLTVNVARPIKTNGV